MAVNDKSTERVPMFMLSEVRSNDWGNGVTLWRVAGIAGTWYPTKIVAEAAARVWFPSENPDQRYARLSYAKFFKEE